MGEEIQNHSNERVKFSFRIQLELMPKYLHFSCIFPYLFRKLSSQCYIHLNIYQKRATKFITYNSILACHGVNDRMNFKFFNFQIFSLLQIFTFLAFTAVAKME